MIYPKYSSSSNWLDFARLQCTLRSVTFQCHSSVAEINIERSLFCFANAPEATVCVFERAFTIETVPTNTYFALFGGCKKTRCLILGFSRSKEARIARDTSKHLFNFKSTVAFFLLVLSMFSAKLRFLKLFFCWNYLWKLPLEIIPFEMIPYS